MIPRHALALLAAFLVGGSNAHTIFQKLWVNGVDQGYLNGIRYPTYDGPITDVTSNDIICNGGPNPLVTPYSQTVINVPAGATVQAEWHHVLQPNGYNSADTADPVDPGHLGPTLAYLAKVPDATQTDVTGLGWFKIQEDGFDGTTWGVTRMYNAKGLHTIKIPDCIPPGNYFLRAEMISFPGAYHGTDPGVTINIYYPPVTNYTIPGPAVFTCPGSGSGSTTTTKTSSTTSKV
ncbi:hypothetical protein FRC04_011011 [Tulasnella sp. 424]|nr:hypothetical protein FRC04_011011 [Tulasnella sp. 424]KAG8972172.1 hypothetical protein FRC05_010342 [Tulasnella sp. 425]